MVSISSFPANEFFSQKNEYIMCIRVYLGEDGKTKVIHLRLRFVIKKGPFGDILQWPAVIKLTTA